MLLRQLHLSLLIIKARSTDAILQLCRREDKPAGNHIQLVPDNELSK